MASGIAPVDLETVLRQLGARTRREAAGPGSATTLDERLTNILRVLVAWGALALHELAPSADASRNQLITSVLAAFAAYAAVQALLVMRRAPHVSLRTAPWIDLAWTTLVFAASDGASSVFFPLYLFGILCASFSGGMRAGAALTLASVASFSTVAALTHSGAPPDRTFVRPVYLLLLGYLVSTWGEHQLRLRARFALLREVTALSNPRFGIDRTEQRLLDALHRFYEAEACHLVVVDAESGAATMRSTPRPSPTPLPVALGSVTARLAPADLATSAFLYRTARRRPVLEVLDVVAGTWARGPGAVGAALAAQLGFESFVSVPFRHGPHELGRLYVGARRRSAFDHLDAEFLLQVLDQVAPVLENVRLVDELASRAAVEERRRIARDVHDSVIQPYVGLLLGVEAARSALAGGDPATAGRHLARLRELGEQEVQDLRSFVSHLRTVTPESGEPPLRAALDGYCDRFAVATGIRVDLAASDLAGVGDRVAVEVFQLVSEALSNVRRHSDATHAEVDVRVRDGALQLCVRNDGATVSDAQPFSPRSLTDRAAALGGTIDVLRPDARTTAIQIEIPL
jgi:signal transduction histidine kinase